MIRTKMFPMVLVLRLLPSVGGGGVALLLILLLLAGLSSPPPVAASPQLKVTHQALIPSVTFILDDFDDAKRENAILKPRNPNNFFANQGIYNANGALITDTLSCAYTYACNLVLGYDLSAGSSAEGGYVEELGFSYTYSAANPATWKLRDLSACKALSFRVRGNNSAGFTTAFEIEFIGSDWGVRDSYPITGVTAAWQVYRVPLADLEAVDLSRLKQVAVRLVNDQATVAKGQLYFDDFAFVGCDFNGDLLDLIERQAVTYFWENRHPATGFVRDRAIDPFYDRNITSIAAIGFELTAFGIGAEHGWLSRTEAALATRQVLDKLWAVRADAAHKGFFYHFLDIGTGQRALSSELSTIDTALLMAGVIFARQYYTASTGIEPAIRQRADQLFGEVDWLWALRAAATPPANQNQFYLAWLPNQQTGFEIAAPGGGYFAGTPTDPTTWDYYTDELLLINMLALGSSTHSVPAQTFQAWLREKSTYNSYTLYASYPGGLFTYFIGQGWLDLRCAVEKETSISWWQNSRLAALANRQFVINQTSQYAAYGPNSWGLSPGLGLPDDPYTPGLGGVGVYRIYGALPKIETSPPLHDGTIIPHAAAGAIMFLSPNLASNEAHQALVYWYTNLPRLWGIYGFVDGFNLGPKPDTPADDWFAHDYIGLDQGMALLALENYQTGLVWGLMNGSAVISRAKSLVFKPSCLNYLPVILKRAGSSPA